MVIYKVIEVWSRDHTESERDNFHKKLSDMANKKIFIPFINEPNNINYSEYIPDMENTKKVIKRFTSQDSAQDYINFVSNLDPISLTIEIEN